jgi:hypothetical protein
MLLHSEPAVRTGAAKSVRFRRLALKSSAFYCCTDFFAGCAFAAGVPIRGGKAVQYLGEKESQGAFADAGRAGKDHGMRYAVLFDRSFENLNDSTISQKIMQAY